MKKLQSSKFTSNKKFILAIFGSRALTPYEREVVVLVKKRSGGLQRVPIEAWYYFSGQPRSWFAWARAKSRQAYWRNAPIFAALVPLVLHIPLGRTFEVVTVYLIIKLLVEWVLRQYSAKAWVERVRTDEIYDVSTYIRIFYDHRACYVVYWVGLWAKVIGGVSAFYGGPMFLYYIGYTGFWVSAVVWCLLCVYLAFKDRG